MKGGGKGSGRKIKAVEGQALGTREAGADFGIRWNVQ
jgi:hypothetical protein